MRRLVITALLLVSSAVLVGAQSPQYVRKNHTFFVGQGCGDIAAGANGRVQNIYFTSDFPDAPTGNVSAIYLQLCGGQNWSKPSVLYDVAISMGYGLDSIFRYSPAKSDTFVTGLSTVYSQPVTSYRIDSQGRWLRFTLLPYSFTFHNAGDTAHQDGAKLKKYWVIEWSSGVKLSENNARAAIIVRPKSQLRGYTYTATSTSVASLGFDIGFDIGPPIVGVGIEPVIAKAGVRLYPNPAADLLNLSGVNGNVNYSIVDITGRVMQQGEVPVSRQLAIQHLPSGMYTLRLSGDGSQALTFQFAKQ